MAKFSFYQDRKVTSWERTTFAVEAKDYREAVDIVKSWQGTDIEDADDERIDLCECRSLWETSECLLPEENDGRATRIVYDNYDAEVMANGRTLPLCSCNGEDIIPDNQ